MCLRLILSVLVSITGLASAARVPGPEERIVGGSYIPIEYVPWQVSVLNVSLHRCGGVVYNDRAILTAAHCLSKVSLADLSVRAGSSHWSKGGQVLKVLKTIAHPKYVPKNYHPYDVAVLILEAPLKLGGTVKKVPLAEQTPVAGTIALVSGWGDTRENSSFSWPILQGAHVAILNRTDCQQAYRDRRITTDMICADGHRWDSCEGDSGGPLIEITTGGHELVGIVSWGEGCGTNLGVYEDIAFFRNWIKYTVQENIWESIVKI
ncbi:trypsin beta [Drosophila simulans]|uniref:trypsin n=1 Tax=Drosophila simulans TaxID=7240 RepID=A0A0J9QUC2_DROSI|nr:trypsin beta [Drosophila simulans]KMY87636.1 uncharacterized protein Dsimw501_GD17824 [Drosophila simulans]